MPCLEGRTTRFTATDKQILEANRAKATEELLKGGMRYKTTKINETEYTYPEATDEQVEKAREIMRREFFFRQRIVNYLKDTQPGDARFESFVHHTIQRSSNLYIEGSAIDKVAISKTIRELRESDSKYFRSSANLIPLLRSYSIMLFEKVGTPDRTARVLAYELLKIRDEKFKEIRRNRQIPQTPLHK